MTDDTIHTCSYSCERPGCIRAQRDELVAKVEALRAEVELWRHKAAIHQYRRKRLAEALRELVAVFSESGMYDEEVFAKARASLAKENSND